MVEKASTQGKQAQFHNDSTFCCGLNEEIKWMDGWELFAVDDAAA
jgi:hypothetical protein